MKLIKKWNLFLGIGFLCIALGLLWSAAYYQERLNTVRAIVDGYKETLSDRTKKMIIRDLMEDYVTDAEANIIPRLVTASINYLSAASFVFLAALVCLFTSTERRHEPKEFDGELL